MSGGKPVRAGKRRRGITQPEGGAAVLQPAASRAKDGETGITTPKGSPYRTGRQPLFQTGQSQPEAVEFFLCVSDRYRMAKTPLCGFGRSRA